MSAQVILTVFVIDEEDCIARQSPARVEITRRMQDRPGYVSVRPK